LIRIKLDLLHQARSVVDCADQYFEVRHKLGPVTRQATENTDEDTRKSTDSKRAQHKRGQRSVALLAGAQRGESEARHGLGLFHRSEAFEALAVIVHCTR
jgi:hypothetical protein